MTRSRVAIAVSVVFVLSLVVFQNCSNINLGGKNTSSSGPDTGTDAPPSPPAGLPPGDLVSYSTTTAADPQDGMDPATSGCPNCGWYNDYIYGIPSPKVACQSQNFETNSIQSWSLRVVTGFQATGEFNVATKTTILWTRFQPYAGGVLSFRFKMPTKEGQLLNFDLSQGGGASLQNTGFVISISRKPCDLRETQVTQTIFTTDYCTIGNAYHLTYPTNMLAPIRVSSTSSTTACHVTPGDTYYLNILKTNDFDKNGFYISGLD